MKRQAGNVHRDRDMSTLDYKEWFAWCQFCKHGGHAQHLTTWFERHQTCGVTGCNCTCSAL